MGRRSRNGDTIQVADAEQTVVTNEPQLQQTPAEVESVEVEEIKNAEKTVDEIPYEDRPIPEAYFPPEEPTQEFIPEPHIQQTVVPKSNYKTVSNKTLNALKFDIKPAKETAEKESSVTKISDAEIDELKYEVKEIPAVKKDVDLATLQFDTRILTPKVDSILHPLRVSQSVENHPSVISPELSANVDTLTVDSLAKDSLAFVPIETVAPKREIVSLDGKEMPQTINNMWWYTPILLIIFIAYTIIFKDRKKAIFSELQSFFKPNTDGSIFGFQWLQNSKYKFFMSVLSVVSASLYLFLAQNVLISSIWIFILAVTVFVVGKHLMLTVLEYIYFEGATISSMSSAFMVLVRQVGLWLIPSVLGLSFAPESHRSIFVYLGIFVIGFAIFSFNFKIIINFLRGITSIFYLILYLCTLEVIPVAIFFVFGLLPRL